MWNLQFISFLLANKLILYKKWLRICFEYLTQLSLYTWTYLCIMMHEKHKRTKNEIRIKTINRLNQILFPAGQVDACSSEDLKSCECEYEDQRERMRHLLATVTTVKTSHVHRLSWAKGTAALSDRSTHKLSLFIYTDCFFFLHQMTVFTMMSFLPIQIML